MGDLHVYYDNAALVHRAPAGEFDSPWTGRLAVKEPHPDRPKHVENIISMLRSELADLTWS